MKFKTAGMTPKTWEDGTPLTFNNWKEGQPGSNSEKMCARMSASLTNGKYSTWETVPCDPEEGSTYLPICMKAK
jgi:hypothetical protein